MGYFASTSASEGALLVGAHDAAGDFTYCGTISVGFTDRARRDLSSQLVPWRQEHSPFSSHDLVVDRRRLCWVKPVIVGRIESVNLPAGFATPPGRAWSTSTPRTFVYRVAPEVPGWYR